jgi:hypothetical protein
MSIRFSLVSFVSFLLTAAMLLPHVTTWQIPAELGIWVPIGLLLTIMLTQLEATHLLRQLAHWKYVAEHPAVEATEAAKTDSSSALPADSSSQEAIQLLRLFQEEGRLVDFLLRDIQTFPDERVGAVARIVHQGCRRVVQEYFEIVPAVSEAEGDRISWSASDLATQIRVVGGSGISTATSGTVLHRGWAIHRVSLPTLIHPISPESVSILVPAEVEVTA